jgi:hypothetical protein
MPNPVGNTYAAHDWVTHSGYRDEMEERFALINRRLALLEDQEPTYARRKPLSNRCDEIGWPEHQSSSMTL